MKKNLLLVLSIPGIFLLVTSESIAQTKFVATQLENNRSGVPLNSHFRNYSLFRINTSAIADFTQRQKGAEALFQLELPGFAHWKFSIAEHDILSKDYTLTINTPTGRVTLPKPACMTYRGYLSDVNDSRVSLTIDNSIIYGMIKSRDKEYFIEPLNYFNKQAAADIFVVYDANDVIPDPNLTCGVTETYQHQYPGLRVEAGTTCVRTELAIASDASMFTRYGTAPAVATHNIGVMNNVIWNYVNAEFAYNIEFLIVTQNVSISAPTDQTTPLYAGTNSSTILTNFAAWAMGGGFGVAHDLGQFWTTRNIDADGSGGSAGIIGLAYTGGGAGSVCVASTKYHILEDFGGSNPSGSGYQLRVLTAHEIGHNFGCGHDGSGTPYIMAPSVGNTSTWSPASITTVDANAPTFACLGLCSVSGAPVASYIVSPEAACTGITAQLTDHSLNGPTSWSWTMTGGTPSSSTVRNPTVSYATSGIKTISFTSTNAGGTSSPYSKNFLVSDAAATACFSSGALASDAGIKSFSLNNISKVTGSSAIDGNKYMDFSCSDVTSLAASTMYSATVNVGFFSATDPTPPHIFNHVRFYIDYNNDGDFVDGGELVYTSGGSAFVGNHTFAFTTPATPIFTDQFLRARIIAADFATGASPCHDPSAGQVEDYSVFFASSVLLSISGLDFDGYHRNGRNLLNWKTFDEKDNDYFEIERSTDGNAFDPIGRVNGVLTSTSPNKYTFTDQLAGVADNDRLYYRLKIVDIFGRIEYSKIIVIINKTDKKELVLRLQPNPFTNAVTATIQLRETNTINMQLIDMTGRVLYRDQRRLPSGIHTFTYNGFENIPKGMYIIKLTSNTETASRLVEKQ